VQREKGRPFLKITLALPNMVSVARGVLEKGMVIPGLSSTPLVLPTFESNVLFILRFMVDCKVRLYAPVLPALSAHMLRP
jgi:DNA polymerase delta subunit 1